MEKTIKQIADELGVSKTAVRKKIENLQLFDKLQTKGNQFLVSETQEILIKSTFSKKNTETENRKEVSEKSESLQLVSSLLDSLKKELDVKNHQLEVKDKQINDLNNRLQEVTKALLTSQKTTHAAQTLHAADTIGLNEPAADEVYEESRKRKKTWRSIFKK